MSSFTPTQGRYLSFIAFYISHSGQPPAESEIAAGLQVSSPSVNRMLKMLAQKGFIRREVGVARSIELLVDPEAIPEWAAGERPTQVIMQRVQTRPPMKANVAPTSDVRHAYLKPAKQSTVYRFKVVLDRTKPPIWRRIEILDCSLAKLHDAIQSAMGWYDCHLHAFDVDGTLYEPPRSQHGFSDPIEETYEGINIGGLIDEYGPKLKLKYWYDFGDSWWHTLTLEAIVEAEPEVGYPRCTAGARCCPPEDVGGVYGFYNYLEIIQRPDHPQYDDMLEWNGEFDPEAFDVQDATKSMQLGARSF